MGTILGEYTHTRHKDLVAICDLALQNYREMSDKVTRVDYLIRKKVDGLLARILRGNWLPL
jgi:kynurenine 3-monooxygenase